MAGAIGEVRMLGPLEVVGPSGPVRWVGGRRTAVFALLALRPGRLVSCSSLIDALWGRAAPATATKTLQSHVAQVCRALSAVGLPGLLLTREPGYLIEIGGARVDAVWFAEHARIGQDALNRGDGHRAVEQLEADLPAGALDPRRGVRCGAGPRAPAARGGRACRRPRAGMT